MSTRNPVKTIDQKWIQIIFMMLLAAQITGCSSLMGAPASEIPVPTPVPTQTSTLTATPAPSATPTMTLTFTPSPTPTITPTPTQTATVTQTATPTVDPSWIAFKSEWLTLVYPPDWTIIKPRPAACMPGSTDCIIHLSHSSSEKIDIEIVRYPPMVPAVADVVEADQQDWDLRTMGAQMLGLEVKLVSQADLVVGGQPAIQRVYEYPIVDLKSQKATGTWTINRVLVMNGKDQYYFEMRTEVEAEFTAYQALVNKIVSTIVFLK